MLLQFDKFLRVVVSSSNIEDSNWLGYLQVIWFQDFPLKSKDSEIPDYINDFSYYLSEYLRCIIPKYVKESVFRREIKLSDYDFS